MPKKYDVVIIGGGASGMCTAAAIKMRNKGISVAIVEQLQRVGKKLITTGNGRCNITNSNLELKRFHGENVSFAEFALKKFDNLYIEDFFADFGIVFTNDETGRTYPYSLQASSVVDSLRFSLDNLGVEIHTETKALEYEYDGTFYNLKTNNGNFMCEVLIFASGLFSGGEKLGSNGSGLNILKEKGYKTVKTTPAIVQVKTKTDTVRSLKGIKVNASATLVIDDKPVRTECGEVLFCDYGLSGPPILQISREIERNKVKMKIVLDLMPEYSYQNICDMLQFRVSSLAHLKNDEFFTGMLNKRVGQAVIKLSGLSLSDSVSALNKSAIKRLASVIKNMTFSVTGTTGFENSQVTAGGIDTSQFNDKTMMSKKESGLYCIGEILDIDGDCGGFNLQWAWSSAICAAESVSEYLGG